jgi:hypothetical protein
MFEPGSLDHGVVRRELCQPLLRSTGNGLLVEISINTLKWIANVHINGKLCIIHLPFLAVKKDFVFNILSVCLWYFIFGMQNPRSVLHFYLLLVSVCRNFIWFKIRQYLRRNYTASVLHDFLQNLDETILTSRKMTRYHDKCNYAFYKITGNFVRFQRN